MLADQAIVDACVSFTTEVALLIAVAVTVYKRSFGGALFILPMAIHYMLKDTMGGVTYFSSSGLLSAMTIMLIIRLCSDQEDIMKLAWACLIVDLIGLGMWAAGQEPYLYAILFIIIYSLSILIIGKGDVRRRDNQNPGWNRMASISGLLHVFRNPKGKKEKAT